MEASLSQIIVTALCTLFFLSFSILVYLYSLKKDRLWFYIYSAILMVMVQMMSDTGAGLFFHGIFLHLASVIVFPSIIFCLFVSFVLQGGGFARQMFYVALMGEIGYAFPVLLLYLFSPEFVPFTIDIPWIQNHLFSTLAIVADYILIFVVWQTIHNPKSKIPLFLKTFITFLIVLCVDSIIFTIGTFWQNPLLIEILKGNLLVRTTISLLVTPFITLYLNSATKSLGPKYRHWDELISLEKHETEIAESIQKIDLLEKTQNELLVKTDEYDKQRRAILNIIEDIQEEKQKLQDLNERFDLATNSAHIGVWEWNIKKNTLNANPLFYSLLNSNEDEFKPAYESWVKSIYEPDRESTVDYFKNAVANSSEINMTHRVLLSDGNTRTLKLVGRVKRNLNGEAVQTTGIVRDITLEAEVDRMKTEFISLASHQLRTPLSAIGWFSSMLLAGDAGDLNIEQRQFTQYISDSNKRMVGLVNSLLNISRIESGRLIIDPKQTDIKDVINPIILEVTPRVNDKKQTLSVDISPELPLINLDKRLIEQVYINLLTNAIKYTPDKGKIMVRVYREGSNLISEIIDNGYGIPEKDQSKIFQKFYRADNIVKFDTEGNGLGLYLVKSIVKSSGGEIWVSSEENNGTKFSFSLPIAGVPPKKGQVTLS